MKKRVLLILLSCFALRAVQNLDAIFGEIPTLSNDDIAKLNNWVLQERDLISSLVIQNGSLLDHGAIHKKNNELLKTKGIENFSRSNYVFVCPVLPQFLIKVSGPTNRLMNTIVANDKFPTTIFRDEVINLKKVSTFQTVSSLPTYYLYLRLTKVLSLRYVYIPKTYLVKLPGASDIIADTNYIIVQERVALLDRVEAIKHLKQLSDMQIRELVSVIASCGLWDIKNKIHVATDGRLIIVDLEQPNVSNPTRGFNLQDVGTFYNNAYCGLDSLKELFVNKVELIDTYSQKFID